MDRQRAAGLLLALAACIATATAAPTASNHTALDLYDGAPDGCYYNFQHYGEGDRIMTNEPCLNCTCHNRMLMCYLKVCPFTKPIGQDCTIEKRADQCCPIVTCPDVPVDLLTSTTTSPAEYGSTGVGKLDKFGCSINGKYFSEGSKVPPIPNKPCEHCYCIRNMTTCVMQECTLHVDGCTPIYHKDVCCPVRYSCDHPEDEMPLLDDLSTTVRPTPGFLLTTTTISPVTQMSQDCVYDNQIFPDGALIKTEKACDHCYCMKGDIVCVVQECGTPMENEGKNCTALPPREGVCCPDTYICEGDEPTTGNYDVNDYTTQVIQEKLTTLSPPRRTSSEGSGYRNEPDYVPYTESPLLEPEIEGSGEEEEPKPPTEVIPGRPAAGSVDDILANTEEPHEYIPLTTTIPFEESSEKTDVKKDEKEVNGDVGEEISESRPNIPSTTATFSEKEEPVTDVTQGQEIGSGEPEDDSFKPLEVGPVTPVTPVLEEHLATTNTNDQNIATTSVAEKESSESLTAIDENDKTNLPNEQDLVTSELYEKAPTELPIDHDITSAPTEATAETVGSLEETDVSEDIDYTKILESHTVATTVVTIVENEVKETSESAKPGIITSSPDDINRLDILKPQHYITSTTNAPGLDDDFVTTETQEEVVVTEGDKGTEYIEPHKHVTAGTPMLEEIEKDTTEHAETEHIVPSNAVKDDSSKPSKTTLSSVSSAESDVTEPALTEIHVFGDHTTETPLVNVNDQQELTTDSLRVPETFVETEVEDSSKPELYAPTTTQASDNNEKITTFSDATVTISSDDDSKIHEFSQSTTASIPEMKSTTTEPDKGLNTIPSDLTDEDISVSHEHGSHDQNDKTTDVDQTITTMPDFDIVDDTVSKQSTISSGVSIPREEPATLTTESAFRKEDNQPLTESHVSAESTIVGADITEGVISTLAPSHTKDIESGLETQTEALTTSGPKYTETIEEGTFTKEDTVVPSYGPFSPEIAVTEKDLEEETATSATAHENLPDTTAANQEDNEIFNEPRIPGEGDCLLNGVTYTNESSVPSTNKCQSGCKCISSIIKCDPIICSPPPEYMDNCETMYDTPDSCCPTYVCDHRTETNPPQSHSQMSGTEAPVISPIVCHGDECVITEDKKPLGSSDACKSGNCPSESDKTQDTLTYPIAEHIPEHSETDKKDECIGDKCTPTSCTNENGCQTSPMKPEAIAPVEPQPCVDGEDCKILNIPSKECSSGDCSATEAESEDTHHKEICTDKEGCQKIHSADTDKECTEDHCKRKDSSNLDQKEQCTELDCKQTNIETSTTAVVPEHTSHEDVDDDNKKEIPVKVTETTDKLEAPESSEPMDHHETSEYPGSHEIATVEPELLQDNLSTITNKVELITNSDIPEVTTKSNELTDQPEYTIDETQPEKEKPDHIGEPEISLPVSTEDSVKETEHVPSVDEMVTKPPEPSLTSQDIESPGKIEITAPVVAFDTETTANYPEESNTESTKVSTLETGTQTESVEKLEPVDTSKVILEENATEPSRPDTADSYDTTKALDENEYDKTTKENIIESITEPSQPFDVASQEITEIPEIVHTETTMKSILESSSEPSKMYTTESQELSQTHDHDQDGVTQNVPEKDTTIPPKPSDEKKDDGSTSGTLQDIVTESTISVGTEEQKVPPEEFDSTSTTLKPSGDSSSTETPNHAVVSQKVTESPEEIEQFTIKDTEVTGTEPTQLYSTESQELPISEDIKHKDIAEEPSTEPPKTYVTESEEIMKSSENVDHEDTTSKILEESSTNPSISHTMKLPDTIGPLQDLDKDLTTSFVEESSTIPSKSHSTESQADIESPETLEHKNITTPMSEETSTESLKTHDTKSPEDIYHEVTTSRITKEPATDKSQTYPSKEQELDVTESEEKEQEKTTIKILEDSVTEPPKDFNMEPQEDLVSIEKDIQEGTTSKTFEEFATEPPKMYTTERQELTKSPESLEYEGLTDKNPEESVTEISKPFHVEPQEITVSSEEVEKQGVTSDPSSEISQEPVVTTLPKTEAQEISKSPEKTESFGTTLKTVEDAATEPSKTQDGIEQRPEADTESPDQYVTASDRETEPVKQTTFDMLTEKPKQDEEKTYDTSESPETITSPYEHHTLDSADLATVKPLSDSKITKPEEIPSETLYTPESQSSQEDVEGGISVTEKLSFTSVPQDFDTIITVTPVANKPEKPYVEGSTEQQDTVKPFLEKQTTLAPAPESEVRYTSTPETLSTHQPEIPTLAEKDLSQQTETQSSGITSIDEHITTSSELHDLTTFKPAEALDIHQDIETMTENSNIPLGEPNTETIFNVSEEKFTEKIPSETEGPAISDEHIYTEKPATIPEIFSTTEIELETPVSQISSDTKPSDQEKPYLEEPVTKEEYPSQESTSKDESTKSSVDEDITTEEPIIHEMKEPTRTTGYSDSLVTEEYESTKPAVLLDIEKESQTETPGSLAPVNDITQPSEPDNVVEKLTTSSNKPETTMSQSSEKSESEYAKPIDEEMYTEPPPYVHKTTSEPITQKVQLTEGDITSGEPSLPELIETVTNTISDKFITEHTDMLPSVEDASEAVMPDISISELLKPATTDQPTVDLHQISPEVSTVSELTEVKATSVEDYQTPAPERSSTESKQEVTNIPEIQTPEETGPSEDVTAALPEATFTTEAPSLGLKDQTGPEEPDDHHAITVDQMPTEVLESSTKQTEIISTESSLELESSSTFERATTSKNEYLESTSKPQGEQEHINKVDDEATVSEAEHSTETVRVTEITESSNAPPEIYTEKQPDKSAPEMEIPTEQTRKPHEPTVYPTTPSIIADIPEKSTRPSVSSEEGSTTLFEEISPAAVEPASTGEEQSIPVIITDIDKTSTPEEPLEVQTEKATVTSATVKPVHETTAPEEEFIVATSKSTTIKSDEEMSTSSPFIDRTTRPTDKPVEPPVSASVPEQPKPISTEVQPTDEVPGTDEEGPFAPSGTSGYGQEPDYVEEDQTFGPGTCRYGGKVYVSAQQIPRDDPCDFCFCFRSDIICLQQSCPPPIHGCHEEPIQGFCCPRYECPVSMATTVNVTTTTTTTTTTLPPHFPTHSYKGSAQRRGCQIKGQTYKVGEVVRASSGPCLHCTCGGDGQMKCDPKVCTPEPMLRQMIAAAVSAKRRR